MGPTHIKLKFDQTFVSRADFQWVVEFHSALICHGRERKKSKLDKSGTRKAILDTFLVLLVEKLTLRKGQPITSPKTRLRLVTCFRF